MYREFYGFNALQWSMFICGLCVMLSGVALLTLARPREDSMRTSTIELDDMSMGVEGMA